MTNGVFNHILTTAALPCHSGDINSHWVFDPRNISFSVDSQQRATGAELQDVDEQLDDRRSGLLTKISGFPTLTP